MNNPIDLNACRPGQKLKSKHGLILTYVRKNDDASSSFFPHIVKYPNKAPYGPNSMGSRTDDGYVMSNPGSRLDTDHDIVEILPFEWKT